MDIKAMYKEWDELKTKSISYQRAGADGYLSEAMQKDDTRIYNRIKEIEKDLFPVLAHEKIVFDNTPIEESERQQDRFYTGSYLVNYIEIEKNITLNNGLVSGYVIFAKTP